MSKQTSFTAWPAYLSEGSSIGLGSALSPTLTARLQVLLLLTEPFSLDSKDILWTIFMVTRVVHLSLQTILHLTFRVEMSQHEALQLFFFTSRIKSSFLSEALKRRPFAL